MSLTRNELSNPSGESLLDATTRLIAFVEQYKASLIGIECTGEEYEAAVKPAVRARNRARGDKDKERKMAKREGEPKVIRLQIIQAKPNPAGKELGKDQDGAEARRPESLYGEWVDVKNTGEDAINFRTMQLRHALFDDDWHTTGELELYWIGDIGDFLKPGQILRIHAGRREDAHLMLPEDQAGADWHGYAESDNFILNNRCGDKIVLSWREWSCKRIKDRGSRIENRFEYRCSILSPLSLLKKAATKRIS